MGGLIMISIVVLVAAFYPSGATQQGPGQAIGMTAPAPTLPRIGGGNLNLQSLRGHAVLMNLWATWCGPCRRETPALQRLSQRERGRLVVVGIDEGESLEVIKAFVRRFELTYPIVLDQSQQLGTQLHLAGLPSSFFVDKNGIIRDAVDGEMTYQTMVEKSQQLFAER